MNNESMIKQVTVTVQDHPETNDTAACFVLWIGYVIATIACMIQVCLQRKREVGQVTESPSNRDGSDNSSGDHTRSMFYRLLCLALCSRAVLLPVEISVKSFHWQLIAETFPDMTFASAWTLLVSFFVQLVGTAAGTTTFSSPSIIMYMIAYCIYFVLILTESWNEKASVLLYAVLCCIYASLFGTLFYFGPRLVSMLQPSLVRRSGLAVRLIACVAICMLTFAARSVDLARMVVAPPKDREWWWKYGALEFIPSLALLIMMYPNRSRANKASTSAQQSADGTRRGNSKRGESAPLTKAPVTYGTGEP